MTVREYFSTDASAPVIGTGVGGYDAVLNGCLVTGYGSRAAAGWSKAFSGTNLSAYRQPAGSSNGMYFRLDDTGATAARIVGYETMSDVNTGTNPFPSSAQLSGGYYLVRPNVASMPWYLATNGKFVILWVQYDAGANQTSGMLYTFGDITSLKSGDAFNTLISCNNGTAYSSQHAVTLTAGFTAAASGYLARKSTQLGSSIVATKGTDSVLTNSSSIIGAAGLPYPNGPDGGLYLAPIYVFEYDTSSTTTNLRGTLPGLWCPCHAKPLTHYDTFNGTGTLAGKTFRALTYYSGQAFVEISDTW